MSKYPPVRIVRPAQFDRGTAQTPGSERRAAIAADNGIATKLWGGIFVVEPGAKTGIHHKLVRAPARRTITWKNAARGRHG
jgi:uncharacterized RmlC-like cupin family protein